MSIHRPRPMMMRAAILAAGLLLAAGLGGCGFTPLYAAPEVTPRLSAIEVTQPDGRLGFFMREYLDDSLARNPTEPAIYRLTLVNRVYRVARGITLSNVASRYEVDLATVYTLTEIATGKKITAGRVSVNVSYDVQYAPYASMTAEQDGERRAAEQAADRVRIELASYFASPRPSDATLPAPDLTTYSERLPGAVMQTPREQAEGELQPQGAQGDILGQTRSITVTPETAQPFSPSEDPNNAIKTLPDTGPSGQ